MGSDERWSRRRFLAQVLSSGLVGLPVIAGCGGLPSYRTNLIEGRVVIGRTRFDRLAGEEGALVLRIPELDGGLLLVRFGSDLFRAYSARCTHQGCEVRPARSFLRCPCHGSIFDLEGQVVRGPAEKALRLFRVDLVGDRIEIVVS